MRDYEFTAILQPHLEEQDRDELVERIATLLAPEDRDSNLKVNQWGLKRLAYPIQKLDEGYYVMYEARLDPTRLDDIEQTVRYIEDILRYLVVRKDE